jgi:hypothetical protein
MREGEGLKDLLKGIEGALPERRLARQPVTLPVALDLGAERITGEGRDLSEHGVRVRTPFALQVGRRVAIDLAPPDAREPIRFDAVVRWARHEEHGHVAGIEFIRASGPRERLREMLFALAEGSLPELRRSGGTTRRMIPGA